MTPVVPALLGLVLLATAARAGEICAAPSAVDAKRPAVQWQADGLAVAVRNGRLMLWPMRGGMKLNRELETEVSFSDRSACAIRLPPGTERGASIPIGLKAPKSIDAAICDDDEGMCIPIHLDLGP